MFSCEDHMIHHLKTTGCFENILINDKKNHLIIEFQKVLKHLSMC